MASWLDSLAMRWLGRRHGWPVWAGREFFYEPDQSIEEIERAWNAGVKGFTTNAPPGRGIYLAKEASNFVIRDNVIRDNRADGIF